MNDHPHDSLPAFALGALDASEASQVLGHVAECPACREDIETWSEVVALLPYAASQYAPPAHVKRRLLAMVAATSAPSAAAPARPERARSPWMRLAAVSSLALALVLGLLFANARQQIGDLNAQIGQRNAAIQQMGADISQRDAALQQITVKLEQMNQQVLQARKGFDFVAYTSTVDQPLAGEQRAEGKMFMRPGDTQALLVVHGLAASAPGKTYQFWFATGDTQVPSEPFTVGTDGFAMVMLEAPQAVDTYAEVMITVEPVPGSKL
ncbi:MAG TPA: anti-sigma factor, partial [Roseiflexaceae bacterium]|nr:anti-sigma factor [Roseiflexaceae bacterium]